MTTDNPLKDWHFLIGKWKGRSTEEEEFGGEGFVETMTEYSFVMDGNFIKGEYEAVRNSVTEHQSFSIMFYDKRNKKILRKSFFTYGFVNNEIEIERTDSLLRFDIVMEPVPQAFDGLRWRSYIKKISDKEIRTGLESAKSGEDYTSYGETTMLKVED